MKDRIKRVRKNSGLTQTDFGNRIGATRSMIASYEGGAVIPGDSILKLISKEFSVSYAWLKTGEGEMEIPESRDVRAKLAETYDSLPTRIQTLIDALVEMDPEWWKTLDAAIAEAEKRQN